ncbi:hypothetical protein EXU85_03660 [Spirosoma sp. KCTC 42546]|uniref:hypothetical protein n=1 Tax=Spirosoma sp. KCTC 42546 TaxID=2520506 RepID=UPI00115AAD51|nr:hypothetical protein [Spirosoma sp. KCTC 42546]QDK77739.1 hypothetical protein EXU85_03660 [Spirosoma sp. KCTC 42546]
MKNLCFFWIYFAVFITTSLGQKLPQKIGSFQTQVDTTNKIYYFKVDSAYSTLEKQISSLRDSIKFIKFNLQQSEQRRQILEKEHVTLISTLKNTNQIIANDKYELNHQYDLLKKQLEQKNRDSIQITTLISDKAKLLHELKSYRDSLYFINQYNSKLVKEQLNTSDYQKSLAVEVASLQKQNENLKHTIEVLQSEKNDQNSQQTQLATNNHNLNQTPSERLEVNIQNVIRRLSLEHPADYNQNLNKFKQLQQECKVLLSKTSNEEQVTKLCTEVDQYSSVLEKLDRARRSLDILYDSQQVNNSIYELNECKKSKSSPNIKVKIVDYIDFLTNYCQLTKDIAGFIHDATVAFSANDKDKATARLQTAFNIVHKSCFTHLEREVISRQVALMRNQKPVELLRGNCN